LKHAALFKSGEQISDFPDESSQCMLAFRPQRMFSFVTD
jgi:hypothetical protein